ncbi:P-type ATPase [Caballeronia grimmiae]|uniref:P-type ATPase n=1 Tax=Caballeronia grimmiae TaxID=1071679 RepID=UPI0038B8A563
MRAIEDQGAAFTEESLPVDKAAAALAGDHVSLAERTGIAYTGTSVVAYSSGSGIVVATGMQTELGNIAGLLKNVEPPRRRYRRVSHLSDASWVSPLRPCVSFSSQHASRAADRSR